MKTSPHESLKTNLALLTTIFLWSSAFVGIRIGLVSYSPGALALLRFLIASACLYGICLSVRKKPKMVGNDKLKLMVIGAFTVGGYHLALNYGELTVSSGIASFIIAQSPVVTTVLAIIFLKERISLLGVFGMSISVSGVCLILSSHAGELNFTVGSLYVLCSTLLGSVYGVFQKHYLNKYNAIEVTSCLVWGGTIPLLMFVMPLSHEIGKATLSATLSAVYLGVFPAAIAYLAWGYVLAKMPASRAVNFLYWMPIITTLLGWAILSEIPSTLALVGGLVALLGVWVLNHSYTKFKQQVLIEEQIVSKR